MFTTMIRYYGRLNDLKHPRKNAQLQDLRSAFEEIVDAESNTVPCQHVSHEKQPLAFYYIGCLIRIRDPNYNGFLFIIPICFINTVV